VYVFLAIEKYILTRFSSTDREWKLPNRYKTCICRELDNTYYQFLVGKKLVGGSKDPGIDFGNTYILSYQLHSSLGESD
jgi:hypothetical protein